MKASHNGRKPVLVEVLLLGLCAAFCAIQILVPPYIGLASNGDFGKVFARFACSPPDGGARNFIYFVSDYEFGPQYFWKSEVQSSENVLAALPILLVKASGARVFNIRWLGMVHLLLFLCAYWALLLCLRPYGRIFQLAIGGLALWIFTDVAYVSYFNSFFSDTAALLGLLLMVPLGLRLMRPAPRAPVLWLFTAAALLFITSKTQHALWGILPALLLVRLRSDARWRALVAATLLLGAEAYMLLTTSPLYSAQPLFSAIFFKLAPNSPSPKSAIRELGLGEAAYRYIGTHAYSPGNPTADMLWMQHFNRSTSYAKLLRYWLRHPDEALRSLGRDLAISAPEIRQLNLANFRQEDGYLPGARTGRFASWSTFRTRLYRRWPGHILLWYTLVIAGAGALFVRHRGRNAPHRWAAAICLGVCAMAILEFGFSSLADANETGRHLFIFHALTEITVCFVAAWVLDAVLQARKSHAAVQAHSSFAS